MNWISTSASFVCALRLCLPTPPAVCAIQPNGINDDAKLRTDSEEKQKALDAAKQELDQIQEQAHKAGVDEKAASDKDSAKDKDQDKDKGKDKQ